MESEDIARIAQLVGYALFLVVYFTFDKVGQHMLRNSPDNLLLPLYFMRIVKTQWKLIYASIAIICFAGLLIAGIYPPYAVFISIGIAMYSGSIFARKMNKNIWEDDRPPVPDT